jgi:hypothetical protein
VPSSVAFGGSAVKRERAQPQDKHMRLCKIKGACKSLVKTGLAATGWAVVGACLGAVAGGAFGVLYGALDGLLHGDPWRLASAATYFAACGAAAGALVTGFARMIDPDWLSRGRFGARLRPAPLVSSQKSREGKR